MNTRQRMQALRRSGVGPVGMADAGGIAAVPVHPACVIGSGQSCEHSLVDRELNRELFTYEQTVRGRFARIVGVLKQISAHQHDATFAERAQQLALVPAWRYVPPPDATG